VTEEHVQEEVSSQLSLGVDTRALEEHVVEENQGIQGNGADAMAQPYVLGQEEIAAQVESEKENDPPANTNAGTALPKYMKPISDPLLSTPVKMSTSKTASTNKTAKEDGTVAKSRKSTRLANRATSEMTMEEQATALLMKKCNFLEKKQKPDEQAKEVFCNTFITPLPQSEVTEYRTLFNLEDGNGLTALTLLVPLRCMQRLDDMAPCRVIVCVRACVLFPQCRPFTCVPWSVVWCVPPCLPLTLVAEMVAVVLPVVCASLCPICSL